MIQLKRAYGRPGSTDATRFLVERLWLRGVKKTALHLDAWLKDVVPTTALRRRCGHDSKKWNQFQRRYARALNASEYALAPIRKASRRGRVTLVHSSHDTEHNNAVALKEYLQRKALKK